MTCPIFIYLYDKFVNDDSEAVYLNSIELLEDIREYYKINNHDDYITSRFLKQFFDCIDDDIIQYKIMKIDKKTDRGYIIDIPKLIKYLLPIIIF